MAEKKNRLWLLNCCVGTKSFLVYFPVTYEEWNCLRHVYGAELFKAASYWSQNKSDLCLFLQFWPNVINSSSAIIMGDLTPLSFFLGIKHAHWHKAQFRLWGFMWDFPGTGGGFFFLFCFFFSMSGQDFIAAEEQWVGPGILRRKGGYKMKAIKTNEKGTRIPQQKQPVIKPWNQVSISHSLIFILLHRDLKSVTFGSNQNRWYGLAGG